MRIRVLSLKAVWTCVLTFGSEGSFAVQVWVAPSVASCFVHFSSYVTASLGLVFAESGTHLILVLKFILKSII